jgi:DNA-binding PadR family transcriptional regulator/nucleoside-triphosphatase THEP1
MPSPLTQLTVEERTLLHLSQFIFSRDEEAPFEATQEGIAEGIGISTTHVPRSVSSLRKKDLVEELKLTVAGTQRRRKVYLPTEDGYRRAQELKKRLMDSELVVRDSEGELRLATLKDLYGVNVPTMQVLDLLKSAEPTPLLDLKDQPNHTKATASTTSLYSRIPSVSQFVGRKDELKRLQGALKDDKVRLIVVTGIAGIGKTTLVAKALQREKREKVFWYRLHEWETLRNMGFMLGEFLAHLGRSEIKKYMEGRKEHDVAEAYEIVHSALADVEAVMVLDDFDKASRNIVAFIRTFLPQMDRFEGMKLIVITRTSIPFFSQRDRVEGRVVEITLEGLEEAEALRLFDSRRDAAHAKELARVTAGHPLLLRLVANMELEEEELGDQVMAQEGLSRFVSEEILAALSMSERRALEAASVHRYPVPPEVLFVSEEVDFDTIDALRRKQLLRSVGGRYVEAVDFLREFVYHRLKPEERRAAHQSAAEALERTRFPGAGREAAIHRLHAGDTEGAAQATLKIAPRYLREGRTEELGALLRDLLDAEGIPRAQMAQLAQLRADLYESVGDQERAQQWRKRAERHRKGRTRMATRKE